MERTEKDDWEDQVRWLEREMKRLDEQRNRLNDNAVGLQIALIDARNQVRKHSRE